VVYRDRSHTLSQILVQRIDLASHEGREGATRDAVINFGTSQAPGGLSESVIWSEMPHGHLQILVQRVPRLICRVTVPVLMSLRVPEFLIGLMSDDLSRGSCPRLTSNYLLDSCPSPAVRSHDWLDFMPPLRHNRRREAFT
jgi:hypothetical protein